MHPQQITLIEQAWSQLAPQAEAAGMLFYDRLFALDPSLRRLFRGERREQARKLMQMMAAAVGLLRRPEQLAAALDQLGRRHAGYGVQLAHYETVGQALIETLALGLGEAFTPAQREAWVALYAQLAGRMVAAQAQGEGDAERRAA